MKTMSRRTSVARRALVSAALVLACLILSSCSDDAEDPPASERIVGTWEPVEVPGVEFSSSFDTSTARVTLDDEGNWSGSDGCNDLQGHYTITDDGDFVSSGDPVAGEECSGGGQVSYEFLFAQTDKVEFTSDGDALFKTSAGENVLVLEPVE